LPYRARLRDSHQFAIRLAIFAFEAKPGLNPSSNRIFAEGLMIDILWDARIDSVSQGALINRSAVRSHAF
jgi:hypothetical protein